MRLILLPLALVAVAGCRPDVRIEPPAGLTAFELKQAYQACLGYENEKDFDKRLACTAAVYGGSRP